MKNSILILFLFIMLPGCDAIDDMKGMFEKQEIVQSAIKEKYGWQTQVGFNMNNGVLTQVTVIFDANEVRNEKVSKLEVTTKDVISTSFKSTPGAIYIQILSTPSEKL